MRDVTASVGIRRGVQCRNRVVDQQTVLGLLDQIPAGQGGNAGIDLEWMPPREGFCQEDLHQAIRAFQRANQAEVRLVDGHVDPGLATIRALNRLAEQAASSAPVEPVGPPPPHQRGDLSVDDLIEAVQGAESANPGETPEAILTMIRQLYYPGTDPDGLTFREFAFDSLLPDAPFRRPDGSRRILTPAGMEPIFFGRLAQRAPENPTPGRPLDNPSPYLVDATAERVDLGHVLLTMDALLHPRAGEPYATFGVPSIDPASWVADLGIAAVWTEQDGQPDAPITLPHLPDGRIDFDGYFHMSAPDADLLGDIDGFNLAHSWLDGTPLSSALIAYYLDGDRPGGYRHRFRMFARDLFGTTDPDATVLTPAMAQWTPRVDRFNDLFAKGIGALAELTPPPARQWQFTREAIARFFQWLLDQLQTEQDRFD